MKAEQKRNKLLQYFDTISVSDRFQRELSSIKLVLEETIKLAQIQIASEMKAANQKFKGRDLYERRHLAKDPIFVLRWAVGLLPKGRKVKLESLVTRWSKRYGVDDMSINYILIRTLCWPDEYNKKPYWREPQICYVEYSDTNKGARTPQETRVIRTYPITIRVHLNATQNDVMGMIKREWPSINKHLWARRRRLPKIREHKYPFELVTFLMANKGIPDRKHLASEANKRFPKYGFGYADVSKIIQDEAKRRRRDLP